MENDVSPRSSITALHPASSSPVLAVNTPQDPSLLDDRIPLHRRSVQLRNSETATTHSRSSSTSSKNISRSPSRVRRASWASIKEDDTEVAQTFITSTVPDPRLSGDQPPTDKTAISTLPPPPDFCSPSCAFRGWKQISLGGRKLSKSYGDLRKLGSQADWVWDTPETKPLVKDIDMPMPDAPKSVSAIELMPFELLEQIISHLSVDLPPNGYTPRNQDLINCLLSCRTLHSATLSVLYSKITVPHSIIFSKALKHITEYPALGTLVRRLDFSHFTSVGLGRTKQMNTDIQNVTSKTLLKCLQLAPNLKEFLVQEHLDDDLSEEVLRKLFVDMPRLRAVDFCACSSRSFTTSMNGVLDQNLPDKLSLRRIGLHECSTLPKEAFEILLPRLPDLKILDIYHTQVTDEALFSIPKTARLTHLNVGKCTQITGHKMVEFLTTHPAVKDSLVYLNLMSDISRYRLLTEEDDVSELLSKLPPTLRSLNLNGAKLTGKHIPALLPLTKRLEELSIANADLSIKEVNSLFVPASAQSSDEDVTPEELNWVPSSLKYLDVTGVQCVTQGELFVNSSVLASSLSKPLKVIELDEKLITSIAARMKRNKGLGWVTRELGRRGWYVREPDQEELLDDGRRAWKMGARWWGMRKVGVAYGEVGGLYGHYMFKK